MLRYAVLGPVEVRDGDRPVDIGGRLPRRLLTVLLAAEGRPVSDDRLAEAVWDGRPPADPPGALQVYVSRLRRALPGAALDRTGSGYRLHVSPDDLDVGLFTARAEEARALAAAGRPDAARTAFGTALELWRGEPFADVPGDDELAAARAALRERYEAVREDSAAAVLATGDHAAAVAVSEALVHATPYREHRWFLLALALYRSGRQADALAAIRRVRALLAAELGVAPGPRLRELEGRMLRQDPELLGGAPATERRLSSFVGRDADLALLDRLVAAHRLVTVVGPAGAGKTRLVTEHAGAAGMVRLADLADPALLASAVAATLGVGAAPGDPREAVARELRRRPGPLVLDNCEHLRDDVARFVVDLLGRVPGLRVVATSRTPLHADGERLLPLAPLPADDAVTLLVDRVRAVRPAWTPGPHDRDDLRRLAEALDGVPLALELAAARTRTFGIADLLAHLDDRFALLGRIPRGTMTPHTTLHQAIAWSIDLLSDGERALALRLWPYEGGFPLDAAGGRPGTLASLADQSVVAADIDDTPVRYRMLETIRAYCRSIDPDPAATREAHAAWVRDLVAYAARELQEAGSAEAMALLHRELPNVRAALAHDLAAAPGHALRTAARLMWFWVRSGALDEGRRALTDALAAADGAEAGDVVRARAALAGLRYVGGEAGAARALLSDAARRIAGDDRHRGLLGEVRYYEALAQFPDGDLRVALSAAAEACRIAEETGAGWLLVAAQAVRGAALVLTGSPGEGRDRLRDAAARAAAGGHVWTAALSELMQAQSMVADGGGRALPLLRSSLRRFRHEDDLSHTLAVLHIGALALTAAGDTVRAATLRGAVHLHRDRHGITPAGTYISTVVPASWYAGAAPRDAPSLAEAVAALEGAAPR